MNPVYLLGPITIMGSVGIVAFAFVQIARLRAKRPEVPLVDTAERLEALERDVQSLQRELTETQERLDFTERVLGRAREERRIEG